MCETIEMRTRCWHPWSSLSPEARKKVCCGEWVEGGRVFLNSEADFVCFVLQMTKEKRIKWSIWCLCMWVFDHRKKGIEMQGKLSNRGETTLLYPVFVYICVSQHTTACIMERGKVEATQKANTDALLHVWNDRATGIGLQIVYQGKRSFKGGACFIIWYRWI